MPRQKGNYRFQWTVMSPCLDRVLRSTCVPDKRTLTNIVTQYSDISHFCPDGMPRHEMTVSRNPLFHISPNCDSIPQTLVSVVSHILSPKFPCAVISILNGSLLNRFVA